MKVNYCLLTAGIGVDYLTYRIATGRLLTFGCSLFPVDVALHYMVRNVKEIEKFVSFLDFARMLPWLHGLVRNFGTSISCQ